MVTPTTTRPSSAASTTVATFLNLESLTEIDMSTLSQSELLALSLCSSSAFDPHSTANDLVVPQLNYSLFNQSDATHCQTYSPPTTIGGPSEIFPIVASYSISYEDKVIVNHLKEFIRQTESSTLISNKPVDSVPKTNPEGIMVYGSKDKKRKRGRKHRDNNLRFRNGNNQDLGNSKGDDVRTRTSDHPKLHEMEKRGGGEEKVIWGKNQVELNEIVTDTPLCGTTDSSIPPVQSVPAPDAISDKGEDGLPSADQELDNVLGFDEFRLDDIEPLNYSFVGRQQSVSAQEVPSELPKDAGMEDGLKPLFRFEPDTVMLNTAGSRLLTSVCVWCRNEFNHEAFDFETQSDSIGYMCPTCKAKISGHLDSFCP